MKKDLIPQHYRSRRNKMHYAQVLHTNTNQLWTNRQGYVKKSEALKRFKDFDPARLQAPVDLGWR